MASATAWEKKYQADSDMRTLAEAEAIEKDPARLKAARAKAREKIAEMTAVLGDKEDPVKKPGKK